MTELAVLVPVLNRPQNVAPLVESFLAGCPPDSSLVFLVSSGDVDEWAAIKEARRGHTRVAASLSDAVTWPQKINYGVERYDGSGTAPEWFLCAADDVQFTEGWWDATATLRDDPRVGVIGTNDSTAGRGNPRVASGEHTCHPLIRGAYIREQGTVDQRGLAVHSGYAHWFVDDELVWTAKSRNAWAYCRDAVIEHLHPYWQPDTIPWDDTYAKGEANAVADRELWESRIPLIQAEAERHKIPETWER